MTPPYSWRSVCALVVLCVAHAAVAVRTSHKCIASDVIRAEDILPNNVDYEPPERRRALGDIAPGYDNIRIKSFLINDTDITDTNLYNFLVTKLVPASVAVLTNALHVVPASSNIKVERDCISYYASGVNKGKCAGATATATCGRNSDSTVFVNVPSAHVAGPEVCSSSTNAGSCSYQAGGAGVAGADLVLYVRSKFTPNACVPGGYVLAYAAPCRKDQLDRTVAGYINFCPDRLSADPNDWDDQVATAVHEMMHVLGFSSYGFAYFRDENGTPRTTRDGLGNPPVSNGAYVAGSSTVGTFTERGGTVKKLVTPAVVREARAHFGCSTLNGAELENQGGSGSAISHFEMRVFESDYMTSTSTPTSYISRILLAVFEDSGWYKVNYTAASPYFRWGKNAGCNFAMDKCLQGPKSFPTPVDAGHFCSASTEGCAPDGLYAARCSVSSNMGSIPAEMQYFTSSSRGGIYSSADYCPMFLAYQDCRTSPGSAPNALTGQSYGAGSRCVVGTQSDASGQRGYCVARRCVKYDTDDVLVQVRLSGNGVTSDWLDCPPGTVVTHSNFIVSLQCPSPDVLCFDSTTITLPKPNVTATVSATVSPTVGPVAGTPVATNLAIQSADPRAAAVADAFVRYLAARGSGQSLTLASIVSTTLVKSGGSSSTYSVTVTVTISTGETLEYSATVTAYGPASSPSSFTINNVAYQGPPDTASAKESTPLVKEKWFIAVVVACACAVVVVAGVLFGLTVAKHNARRVQPSAPQQPMIFQAPVHTVHTAPPAFPGGEKDPPMYSAV
eukprot:Opistho-2@33885